MGRGWPAPPRFTPAKATASVSIIDETTRLLRHRSPLALRTLTYSCLQHAFDYRLRVASGSDAMLPSAAAFDRAIGRAAAVYTGSDVFADPLLAGGE